MQVENISPEEWETLHKEAVYKALDALKNIRGMFVAYNANIDAIKYLSEADLQRIVDKVDSNELTWRMGQYPRSADTPLDLIARLMISIEHGKAAEIPVYAPQMNEWLEKEIGFDEKKLGGQAGIITNLLSTLDINRVITFVPWLSMDIAERLGDSRDNVLCPVLKKGIMRLVPPPEAAGDKGRTNWILEYRKGTKIRLSGRDITCPRDNRLILSSRPPWLRVKMEDAMLAHLIDGAVLSGYQLIRKDAGGDDGENDGYEEEVKNSVDVISALKQVSPQIKIHVEMTSIQDREIREMILSDIIRNNAHSIGMDAVEVANALSVLEQEEMAKAVLKSDEDITHLFEGAVWLFNELKLERIHVHALGRYVCICTKEGGVKRAEAERDGLLFASSITAARAKYGAVKFASDALNGLSVPISERGIGACTRLMNFLMSLGGKEIIKGVIDLPDYYCITVPTKVVESPAGTVGLGDIISSSSFTSSIAMLA